MLDGYDQELEKEKEKKMKWVCCILRLFAWLAGGILLRHSASAFQKGMTPTSMVIWKVGNRCSQDPLLSVLLLGRLLLARLLYIYDNISPLSPLNICQLWSCALTCMLALRWIAAQSTKSTFTLPVLNQLNIYHKRQSD